MGIKSNFFEGLSNVSRAFPVMGKVIGTGMVLKQVGNLKKSSSKLFKGGIKL